MKKTKLGRFCATLLTLIMVTSVFTFVSVAADQLEVTFSGAIIYGEATVNEPLIFSDEEVDELKVEFQAASLVPMVMSGNEISVAVGFTAVSPAACTGDNCPGYSAWGYCRWGICPVLSHIEPTRSGTYLSWWSCQPAPFGYRIFRSLSPESDGISITDFPISSRTNFIFDANVFNVINFDDDECADLVVYYRIEVVLEEARLEFDDNNDPVLIPEVLTWSNRWVRVDYGNICDAILPRTRGSIILTLDNTMMQVNRGTGLEYREIDPGAGTVPTLTDGRTMVPVRRIVETMNSDVGTPVGWDPFERRIDLSAVGLDGTTNNVRMWLDRVAAEVNGIQEIMDVPPFINPYDRTLLPLRFVADYLGSNVEWIASTRQVIIVYLLQ